MDKLKNLMSGCLIISLVVLVFGCWLATLIFGLPTLSLLQGM